MKPLKTLSLSIDEIKALLTITDDADRRHALDYLTDAIEHPEQVNPDEVATEHPAVQAFARRIHRRVRAAQKRTAHRVKNASESKPAHADNQPAPTTAVATLAIDAVEMADVLDIHALKQLKRFYDQFDRMLHTLLKRVRWQTFNMYGDDVIRPLITATSRYLQALQAVIQGRSHTLPTVRLVHNYI